MSPRMKSSQSLSCVLKPKSLLSTLSSTLRLLGCFTTHSCAPSPSATRALNLLCSCRPAGGAEAFLLVPVVASFYSSPTQDSIPQCNKQRLWLLLLWYVLGFRLLYLRYLVQCLGKFRSISFMSFLILHNQQYKTSLCWIKQTLH